MKDTYLETVSALERLHRLFLEVVKGELTKAKVRDVNNVQALVVYHIGHSQLTVGELSSKGYYLGTNVSYNLNKLIQNGYVIHEPSPWDKRSSHIKLSPKGIVLLDTLNKIFDNHRAAFRVNVTGAFNLTMHSLESFWTEIVDKK